MPNQPCRLSAAARLTMSAFCAALVADGKVDSVSDGSRGRLDVHGNVLPETAVARLGALGFRTGDSQPYRAVAYSRDGKYLAVLTAGYTLHLWHAASDKKIGQIPNVFNFTFRENEDKVVGLDTVYHVRVWEIASGRAVEPFGNRPMSNCSFSPDGKTVALCQNKMISLYQADDGREITQIVTESRCSYAFFSPDGRRLAALALTDKGQSSLALMDIEGKKVVNTPGEKGRFSTVRFAPDGKSLAAFNGNNVRIFDAVQGKELKLLAATGVLHGIYSTDGKSMILLSTRGIQWWDLEEDKEIRQISLTYAHSIYFDLKGVAIAPDGKTLAAATAQSVRFFDALTGQTKDRGAGHSAPVTGLYCSADGKIIRTTSQDHSIRPWDAQTGKSLGLFQTPSEDVAIPNELSPDGALVACVTRDKSRSCCVVCCRDAVDGRESCKIPIADTPQALAFSPDARFLAVALPATIHVFLMKNGKEIARVHDDSRRRNFTRVAFLSDGATLAAWDNGVTECSLLLFETQTGKEKSRVNIERFLPHEVFNDINNRLNVTGMHASPKGDLLAVVSGYSIFLIDTLRGRLIRQAGGLKPITSNVAFSPDGGFLAAGAGDGALIVCESNNGSIIVRQNHYSVWANRVAFSADGKRLLSGHQDGTGLVWDLDLMRRNFNVTRTPPPDKELEALWKDLAGDDAKTAHEAILSLAAQGEKTLTFFTERLRPTPEVDPKIVAGFLAGLDDADFATRDKAYRELLQLGKPVERYLVEELKKKQSTLDLRRRLERLCDAVQTEKDDPKLRQECRAAEALEKIATPEALAFLNKLAQGAPSATLTKTAKMMLQVRGIEAIDLLARLPNIGHAMIKNLLVAAIVAIILLPTVPSWGDPLIEGRNDTDGFPLPDGATARLGSSRFSQGENTLIRGLSYSHDGKLLAALGADAVHVWDSASGKSAACIRSTPLKLDPQEVIRRRQRGELPRNHVVSFAFQDDRLATLDSEGVLQFWNPTTGKECAEAKRGMDGIFFSDGASLGSMGAGSVRFFDVASGKETKKLIVEGSPNAFSVSRDGRKAAVIYQQSDGQTFGAALFEVETSKVLAKIPIDNSGIFDLRFSRDGKTLLATDGTSGRLFDTASGKEIGNVPGVVAGKFSADGKILFAIVARTGGQVLAWNIEGKKEIFESKEYPYPQEAYSGVGDLRAIDVSPNGKTLAFVSSNKIHFLESACGKEIPMGYGHLGPAVTGLHFTSDGAALFSTGNDFTLRRWDGDKGKELGVSTVERTPTRAIAPQMSANGRFAIVIDRDLSGARHTMSFIECETGKEKFQVTVPNFPVSSAFSPGGDLCAVSTYTTVHLFRTKDGREVKVISDTVDPSKPVYHSYSHMAFSPNGTTLAALDRLNTGVCLRFFEVMTGKERTRFELSKVLPGKPEEFPLVMSLVYSPTGAVLAVVTPKAVALIDPSAGRILRQVGGFTQLSSNICFSADGKSLFAGTNDGSIICCDTATGDLRFRRSVDTRTGIGVIAMSPDGKSLAAGYHDGVALIWDVNRLAKLGESSK